MAVSDVSRSWDGLGWLVLVKTFVFFVFALGSLYYVHVEYGWLSPLCDDLSPIPHADCALAYSLNSPLDTNRGNPSLTVPRYLLLDVERQLRALLVDIELHHTVDYTAHYDAYTAFRQPWTVAVGTRGGEVEICKLPPQT